EQRRLELIAVEAARRAQYDAADILRRIGPVIGIAEARIPSLDRKHAPDRESAVDLTAGCRVAVLRQQPPIEGESEGSDIGQRGAEDGRPQRSRPTIQLQSSPPTSTLRFDQNR